MSKLYMVRETQFGYTIDGPNGHKWQAAAADGWTKAVATAKAFQRAYLEGQKSITTTTDILVMIELIKSLSEETSTLSIKDVQARLRTVQVKTEKVSLLLEQARTGNTLDRVARPPKPAAPPPKADAASA